MKDWKEHLDFLLQRTEAETFQKLTNTNPSD